MSSTLAADRIDWAAFFADGPAERIPELRRRLADWTTYVLTTGRRPDGPWQLDVPDDEYEQAFLRWGMQAYEAVRAGLPVYLALLDDPDRSVCAHAALLLVLLDEDHDAATAGLRRVLETNGARRHPSPSWGRTSVRRCGSCVRNWSGTSGAGRPGSGV